MKNKRFIKVASFLLIFTMLFAFAVLAGGCVNNVPPETFYINIVGRESERKETVCLKNQKYSNTSYTATVSGKVYCLNDGVDTTYTIKEENVAFNQVAGDIWKADISILENETKIAIFAIRAGSGTISGVEEVEDQYGKISANLYEKFGKINCLYYAGYFYLK